MSKQFMTVDIHDQLCEEISSVIAEAVEGCQKTVDEEFEYDQDVYHPVFAGVVDFVANYIVDNNVNEAELVILVAKLFESTEFLRKEREESKH